MVKSRGETGKYRGETERGSLRTAKGVQTVKAHTEKKKERRIRWKKTEKSLGFHKNKE